MTFDAKKSARNLEALAAKDASAQETMAFLLRMRARGVSNLNVLRALESVPRLNFVPHRYADLAARDLALPIGCGQTMSEPYDLARIIEALAPEPAHRALEIGTGSGYGTALIARLVGEVVSFERFRTLAMEAALRLKGLEVANASAIWGDGLALPEQIGFFDRIYVDAALTLEQASLMQERLAQHGVLVVSIVGENGAPRRLLRIQHGASGFVHEELGVSHAATIVPGTSQTL